MSITETGRIWVSCTDYADYLVVDDRTGNTLLTWAHVGTATHAVLVAPFATYLQPLELSEKARKARAALPYGRP